MQGVVNSALEATVPIRIFGPGGQTVEVVAVIDTGYSGTLSLPASVITSLALSPLAARTVRLADQSTRSLNTYEAEVLWVGQRRALRVLELDGDPLIGTALLKGFQLAVEFVDGGSVAITAPP
jgi:clan AA aspartic protease